MALLESCPERLAFLLVAFSSLMAVSRRGFESVAEVGAAGALAFAEVVSVAAHKVTVDGDVRGVDEVVGGRRVSVVAVDVDVAGKG